MRMIENAMNGLNSMYRLKPQTNCAYRVLNAVSEISPNTLLLDASFFLKTGPLFEATASHGPMSALLSLLKIQEIIKKLKEGNAGYIPLPDKTSISLKNVGVLASSVSSVCKFELFIKRTTGTGFSFDTKLVKEVVDFVGAAIGFFDFKEIKTIARGSSSPLVRDFNDYVAGIAKVVEIVAGKFFLLSVMACSGASLVLRSYQRLSLNKDKIARVSALSYYALVASGGVQLVSAFVANYRGVEKKSSR